jgi:hypothetical protein
MTAFCRYRDRPSGTLTLWAGQPGPGTRSGPQTKLSPRRVRYAWRAEPAPLR